MMHIDVLMLDHLAMVRVVLFSTVTVESLEIHESTVIGVVEFRPGGWIEASVQSSRSYRQCVRWFRMCARAGFRQTACG